MSETSCARTLRVGQEHELLLALERAGLTEDDAQAVIQSPENVLAEKVVAFIRSGGLTITPTPTDEEQLAIKILGKDKVVTFSEVCQAWGIGVSKIPSISFPEEVLQQAAAENEAGEVDWRLVYVFGLSLRQQRDLRGTDTKDWWLGSDEDSWAAKGAVAGYYLLNFHVQFTGMTWRAQQDEISRLSDQERAPEQIVSEAMLSVFMTTGQRLLKVCFHWGPSLDSSGGRVVVGVFDRGGLSVGDYHPGISSSSFGVVLARKF